MDINKIDAKITNKYITNYLVIYIDDIPLDIFLYELTKEVSYKGLVPAWSLLLENKNEQDYIWEILNEENTQGLSLPILLCPDDLDFWCIVIVAKVLYTSDKVIWEKTGAINRKNWDVTEWRKSGIRDCTKWSNEDWYKYQDSFDFFDPWDKQWEIWISQNWMDEEKRRIHNYIHQYFNTEENVQWFSSVPKLIFEKEQYRTCIQKFHEHYE